MLSWNSLTLPIQVKAAGIFDNDTPDRLKSAMRMRASASMS